MNKIFLKKYFVIPIHNFNIPYISYDQVTKEKYNNV